ncbi:MAG: diguanylate cyclase [Candidatus Omnitrophica bacterium]|nr:diguanylate cyclase [Candidatus Omnitrophota bacterium]
MGREFNILIVEDDEKTFDVLKQGLAAADYKIWRAVSGAEALKLAKEIYFMVVITEIRTADMDGVELIRRLKKIDYKINVIALTAYSFIDSAVKALKAGAFTYLTKPLNTEEVRLIVQKAIENTCLLIQAGKRKYYQDMSILDGLTGVYNHRHFHEKLDWQIAHLRRSPQAFCLFMLDIDDFKKYNDTKGHQEGDKVLHNVAQLVVTTLRDSDLTFRYGGEEFAVILPQTTQQDAGRVAERLIAAVRSRLPVTISVGISTFPDNVQVKSDLIGRADKALYRAKRLGKDRFCVFDERLDK